MDGAGCSQRVAVPAVAVLYWHLLYSGEPALAGQMGMPDQARQVLARIGGAVLQRGSLLRNSESPIAAEHASQHRHGTNCFIQRRANILAWESSSRALQQWSGINIIFNYAEEILSQRWLWPVATLFSTS